ncbi:hypothetical protein OH76DRAFT_1454946 [Lentinus brumalis]|uniref:Uncharacterized protein n=1 Tax=Lentinus brumalis TaxID=2498619 RepID=A0A371DFW4_9APHY|nr:hypothetical protein OH76DRAFT_1454946 [Polyporus brumalis]
MTSTLDPAHFVSEQEAWSYFSALPSSPRFKPSGFDWGLKQALRPVLGHKLVDVWGELGPKVAAYLDSVNVKFTTRDGVRFVFGGEPSGPVTLWIGRGYMTLLNEFDINDVEIEFRDSIYTRSAGPKFLEPDTPHSEGTGGGDSDNVVLVTAGHVVFPPDAAFNDNHVSPDSSAPRHDVLLLGTKAYNDLVTSIDDKFREHESEVDRCKRQIRKLESEVNPKNFVSGVQEKRTLQKLVRKQCEVIEAYRRFREEVTMNWADQSQRVVGHVVRSPPITLGAGSEGYTEDYAVVELDRSKFDKSAFRGNVIELDREDHPYDRLFKLRGHLTEDDMRHPNMLDKHGEECLIVVKNFSGSGVTVGQAIGVFSYVREEWAILPYDHKRHLGAFSAAGDSGSVIADGRGRFGGLLTGAAGAVTNRSDFDITYATPSF